MSGKRAFVAVVLAVLAVFSVCTVAADPSPDPGADPGKFGLTNKEAYQIKESGYRPRGTSEKKLFTAKDGSTIEYILYSPECKDGDGPYPMILYLHGAGFRGGNADLLFISGLTGFLATCMDIPAYVVSPQLGFGKFWPEIAGMVMELVGAIGSGYPVDPERIIITGHSMGGSGAYEIGARYPSVFSCIAPVSGNSFGANLANFKGKEVLIAVGERENELLALNRMIRDKINAEGGFAHLAILPGGQHSSAPDQWYFDSRLYEYMFTLRAHGAI